MKLYSKRGIFIMSKLTQVENARLRSILSIAVLLELSKRAANRSNAPNVKPDDKLSKPAMDALIYSRVKKYILARGENDGF